MNNSTDVLPISNFYGLYISPTYVLFQIIVGMRKHTSDSRSVESIVFFSRETLLKQPTLETSTFLNTNAQIH